MAGRSTEKEGRKCRAKKGGGMGGDVPKHGPGGDSRAKRIETIKEDYDSGQYDVRPERVAQRMLADEIRRIRTRGN